MAMEDTARSNGPADPGHPLAFGQVAAGKPELFEAVGEPLARDVEHGLGHVLQRDGRLREGAEDFAGEHAVSRADVEGEQRLVPGVGRSCERLAHGLEPVVGALVVFLHPRVDERALAPPLGVVVAVALPPSLLLLTGHWLLHCRLLSCLASSPPGGGLRWGCLLGTYGQPHHVSPGPGSSYRSEAHRLE